MPPLCRACLFSKEFDVERFDALIGRIPGSEQGKTAAENMPEENRKQPGAKAVIEVGPSPYVDQGELTVKSDRDPRRDHYRKDYLVRMKAGETYILDMQSTELNPYLRVESANGVRKAYDRAANIHLVFAPPASEVYRVVASSSDKDAVGHFTLQISHPQAVRFPNPRLPLLAPKAAVEQKAPPLNLNDLAALGDKQSKVRMAAFKNLTGNIPNDLPYRHARKIANYLLLTEWEPLEPEREFEAAKGQLPSLAKCRHLFEALADIIDGGKLSPKRTEAIVGGLLKQRLRFDPDENWRSACRKLLLQRALELTGRGTSDADKTADYLRDLYKEQGLAFGLDTPDFEKQTKLLPVLEHLVTHVAVRAAQQKKLAPEGKAYLQQIGRQLQAARFVAENDLEYMVVLQRIWIKVLALALQEQITDQANKRITAVQLDLDKKDREAGNLLDQLRSGEENILRIWALAHDLKLK